MFIYLKEIIAKLCILFYYLDSAGWRPLPAGSHSEVQVRHGIRVGSIFTGEADGQPTVHQTGLGI